MTTIIRKTEREYGLDLLRSLSMVFVIVLHLIGHGGLGEMFRDGTPAGILVSLANFAVYPAVDCFVLLSGYLLCERPFRVERIIKVWLPAVFWSVVIQCIFFLKDPDSISAGTVVYMFLPVLNGRYWFLNAYIVMMLLSPVMNRILRSMSKWQLRGILLSCVLIFCVAPIFALGSDVFKTQSGYGFAWFLALYLCGGYIRLYTPKLNRKQSGYALLSYVGFVVGQLLWVWITGLLNDRLVLAGALSGLFLRYTSIPVFGSALCLLHYFRSERFSEPGCLPAFLGRLSGLVFAVYLIHDHPLIRETVVQNMFRGMEETAWYLTLLWAAGVVCVIFLLCVAAEWIRAKLFRVLRLDAAAENLCRKLTDQLTLLLKR